MKKHFKSFVLFLLKRFAKRRMRKFKGKVICVTGSVGKTSIKEAIYTVLNSKFRVLKNPGNMNTEFGLPLTILRMESGYSSAMKWGYLLLKGFYKSFLKMYSEVLVVETGVDTPGDMDVLMSIVKPDIAVVNLVVPVHLEEGQFESLDQIFEEKAKLVHALSKETGIAILNIDDERVQTLTKGRSKKNTLTFGTDPEADFKATGIEESLEGLVFNLSALGTRTEAKVPILGKHHVSVVLPAVACGIAMGMELPEIMNTFKRIQLPPGRMNLIEGAVEGSVIIDGTYNSSPKSCTEALKTLKYLKPKSGGRRVAVLGTMNELGKDSGRMHAEVAKYIPESCDVLVAVGKGAETFYEYAKKCGMKNIHTFATSQEAVDGFADKIRGNDIILTKGSQNNVRLERFVKAVMKNPENAKDLLVRQGRHWQQNF